jgi:hypothetical protein
MQTISQLKSENHSVISKLMDIYKGNTPSVDYSTTIFESLEKYKKAMAMIGGNIIGSQIKNFVNTPLVAERGNQNKTYFSHPDKGVGFGYIFIDYIKKNPLFVLVVDKEGTEYKYSSCAFDKSTKTWVDTKNITAPASSVNELIDFIITNLSEDIVSITE